MNSDNFTQYLEDPSRLYQASYQELKTLALQYPYCQNLHLLLFQKSFMEGSGEWEQNLEKAAIYSIDRKHLYHQARKLDKKAEETAVDVTTDLAFVRVLTASSSAALRALN